MARIPRRNPTARAPEIVASVKISHVYRALDGREPRRTGSGTWRAPAVWRSGEGFNVSMDDSGGVWHDLATNEGGGVLDLVTRIRGGSRQGALRWLAGFAQVPLSDSPSGAERSEWAKERCRIELELPRARFWRRAAIALSEQVIDSLGSFGSPP
jgi:hypothetical protein